MTQIKDLTTGAISGVIIRLASPLIAASFVQMAYTMTDMLWLGHLGSEQVAAVGAAFFYVWMSNSVSYCTKSGAEVLVSQSLGSKDTPRAIQFADHAVRLAFLLALAYSLLILIAAPWLLSFFDLAQPIREESAAYLYYIIPGMIFGILNNTFSGIIYGMGNSKTPFRILIVGLIINIVMDPLLIYGIWIFPEMGVRGAAMATSLSQGIVILLFLRTLFARQGFLKGFKMRFRWQPDLLRLIVRIGLPVTLQNALFAFISMVLTAMTAQFGHIAVAVTTLGGQLEAISWMTSDGFCTALGSFTGQNYGAGLWKRIRQGYYISLFVAGTIGLVAGLLFLFQGKFIFQFFLSEQESIALGALFLYIEGYSQFFMVAERVSAGGFNGLGKTHIPAVIGIAFNALRIPTAWLFVYTLGMGVTGIWWAISLSSILKGVLLSVWYMLLLHSNQRIK
ncbi:MAG: MATE family efflux transporter [Bacteroidales bacterium]|nr:MATE family efflux transporter [Bacteroidales bacterium]MDD3160492.1 MATE family efflux transporter [Bacteroidales bacterium]